jgi:ATP-dependent Clp protease ATP-binding subunit ClpA
VDLYRYGIRENPWEHLSYDDFENAEKEFYQRVKGQNYAISKTLDIIKRAMTGMNGLQHSSHSKPKGVLFFAGPTGTGKTETAKTLSQKIFGDESRCIRFDMSEFSQSHSDQRLLGAPPGYVGYEAGGQLTNAVRNNPFSIILFDEIEKAHPLILDKFLQILEDGRMTDGQGKTVYFSEAVIIFTSNLGISQEIQDPATGMVQRKQVVTPELDYEEVQQKVMEGIERYFKEKISRPEILNRIGENIVIFDFIRPQVAELILNSQIKKIISRVSEEKKIRIEISDKAREHLLEAAKGNLENGGRGIGNVVESHLINPLSRALFDLNVAENGTLKVVDIRDNGSIYELECEVL